MLTAHFCFEINSTKVRCGDCENMAKRQREREKERMLRRETAESFLHSECLMNVKQNYYEEIIKA